MGIEIDKQTGERRVVSSYDDKTTYTPNLSRLDDMTREEIVALVRVVSGATGALQAALMTEEEAYDAVCLKFLSSGLSQPDIWKALPALKEWADRRKGKAVQRIDQRIEHSGKGRADEMTNEQLFALIAKAGTMGLLPGGVTIEGDRVVTDAEYQPIEN